jgi:hypothetical protein
MDRSQSIRKSIWHQFNGKFCARNTGHFAVKNAIFVLHGGRPGDGKQGEFHAVARGLFYHPVEGFNNDHNHGRWIG